MRSPTKEYVQAFAELAAFTRPKCGSCRLPFFCCTEGNCEMTRLFALETFGIELEDVGDTIPFLGPNGCVVPPHLRPICSVHICEQHLKDDGWTERYMELREVAAEELEKVDPVD